MTKVILFGLNEIAQKFVVRYKEKYDILQIFDNDCRTHGNSEEIAVSAPEYLQVDKVIVTTSAGAIDAYDQLLKFGYYPSQISFYNDVFDSLIDISKLKQIKAKGFIVASMPKTATTWIGHVLRRCIWSPNIPIKGSNWTIDEGVLDYRKLELISQKGGVGISHIVPCNKNIQILEYFNLPLVLNVRNPKFAAVSAAHFIVKHINEHPHPQLFMQMSDIPNSFLHWSKDEQLTFYCAQFFKFALDWLGNWRDFLGNSSLKFQVVKYEHFANDPKSYGNSLCEFLTLPSGTLAFQNVNPKRGEMNFRRGQNAFRDIEDFEFDISQSTIEILEYFGYRE